MCSSRSSFFFLLLRCSESAANIVYFIPPTMKEIRERAVGMINKNKASKERSKTMKIKEEGKEIFILSYKQHAALLFSLGWNERAIGSISLLCVKVQG